MDVELPTPRDGPIGRCPDGRHRFLTADRTVFGGHDAILEFETVMRSTYVNAIDMIRGDDEGPITDFKVMIRPLRAIDAVRQSMVAAPGTLRGDGDRA